MRFQSPLVYVTKDTQDSQHIDKPSVHSIVLSNITKLFSVDKVMSYSD